MATVNVTISLYDIQGERVSVKLASNSNDLFDLTVLRTEESDYGNERVENVVAPNASNAQEMGVETGFIETFGNVQRAFYQAFASPDSENPNVEYASEDLVCRADNGIIVIQEEEYDVINFLNNRTNYPNLINYPSISLGAKTVGENGCLTVGLPSESNYDAIIGNVDYRYCNVVYRLGAEWYIQTLLLNPHRSNVFRVGFKAFTYTGEGGSGDTSLGEGSTIDALYLCFANNTLISIL